MSTTELIELINKLPADKQKEVEEFIGLLLNEQKPDSPDFRNGIKPGFGGGKGMFGKMADDFDEPLEDFKEYM